MILINLFLSFQQGKVGITKKLIIYPNDTTSDINFKFSGNGYKLMMII